MLLVSILPVQAEPLKEYYSNEGWDKLSKYLVGLSSNEAIKKLADTKKIKHSEFFKFEFTFKTGTSFSSVKMTPSQLIDISQVLNKLSTGDWEGARDQSVGIGMAYFFPLFGQYMGLQDAVSTTITSVIENWSESLYSTRAYRDLVDILNETIVLSAKNKLPYIPSFYIYKNDDTKMRMLKLEEKMFYVWMSKTPEIELSTGSNPARIRQILNKDTKNMREVFNHFLKVAVNDQKGFIKVTFDRVTNEAIEEAKIRLYEKTVKSLNEKLKKLSEPSGLIVKKGKQSNSVNVSFKGLTNYKYNIRLWIKDSSLLNNDYRKVFDKTVVYQLENNWHNILIDTKGTEDIGKVTVTDDYGREISKRFVLKEDVKIDLKASMDYYGGKPLTEKVQNGDILAFEANIKIPESMDGVKQIKWVVYSKKGEVEGLKKVTSFTEKGFTKNSKFRFRLDSLAEGNYVTEVSLQKSATESYKKSVSFQVAKIVEIEKLLISTDKEGNNTVERVIYHDKQPYLHLYFNSLAYKLNLNLRVKNSHGNQVIALSEDIVTESVNKTNNVSLMLDKSKLNLGEKYIVSVILTTKEGKADSAETILTRTFYNAKITNMSTSARIGESVRADIAIPEELKPPLKVIIYSDGAVRTYGLSSNKPYFYFTPKKVGENKIRLKITDSQKRQASAFTKINVKERKKIVIASQPVEIHNTYAAPKTSYETGSKKNSSSYKSSNMKSKTASNSARIAEGKNILKHISNNLIRELVPSCAQKYFRGFSDKVINGTSKNDFIAIANMSLSERKTFEAEQKKRSASAMLKTIMSNKDNQCNSLWIKLLHSKGYVSNSQLHAFENSSKKYYAVMTLFSGKGKDATKPVSCSVTSYRPQTGVFNKITNTQYCRDYDCYQKWVAAAGPCSQKGAKKICDGVTYGKIRLIGRYTPFYPTFGTYYGYNKTMSKIVSCSAIGFAR